MNIQKGVSAVNCAKQSEYAVRHELNRCDCIKHGGPIKTIWRAGETTAGAQVQLSR